LRIVILFFRTEYNYFLYLYSVDNQNIYHHRFNGMSDVRSRETIMAFMRNRGFEFRHGSKYGIDLVSDAVGLELEHRSTWRGNQYPYQTYNFLNRKAHLFKSPSSLQPYFIILNSDYSSALMISRERLLPYLETPINKLCAGSYYDTFCEVPISEFINIDLTGIPFDKTRQPLVQVQ
jgi:hypothetical protein